MAGKVDLSKPFKVRDWTTPVTPTRYVKIITPDTKFDPAGVYSFDHILDAEQEAIVRQVLEAAQDAAMGHVLSSLDPKKDAAKIKKLQKADLPLSEDFDEDGNPTGKYILRVKRKASGQRKDGSAWSFKIPIKDAKGKPVSTKGLQIWGGSELRANISIDGWLRATDNAVGITLKIQAVQIAKLVSGGANDSFGEIEGGYEADDAVAADTSEFNDDLDDASDDEAADF